MLKPNKLTKSNFLSSLDLSTEEVFHILELASYFKNKKIFCAASTHYNEEKIIGEEKPAEIIGDGTKDDTFITNNHDEEHYVVHLSKSTAYNLWAMALLFVVINLGMCICCNRKKEQQMMTYLPS